MAGGLRILNQLLRAQLEILSSDPSAGLTARVFYNSSDGKAKVDDGTNIRSLVFQDTIGALSNQLCNLGLAVTANNTTHALTIDLKNKSGSDPSATSSVLVGFRNATSTTGQFSQVEVTSALSLTVSSGSTLGTTSAVACYVYVYLINNAGTAELAVSSALYDEGSTVSTTAEGGAGAADSGSAIYSTTARSNVAVRLIGRFLSTQSTAGTWDSAVSELSLVPFRPRVGENLFSSLARSSASGASSGTTVNVASISVPPGDWLVSGAVNFRTAANTTQFYGAISTTSATLPGGDGYAGGGSDGNTLQSHEGLTVAGGNDVSLAIPAYRVSLSVPTTLYLCAQSNGASNKPNGYIQATRIR